MQITKRTSSKPVSNGVVKPAANPMDEISESRRLVLWRSPATTLYYFLMECFFRFTQLRFVVSRNKSRFCLISLLSIILICLNYTDGPHYQVFQRFKKISVWWGWWVWLGFLSSCGFGTGLHTFVLYLGPFIAEVTMSAYECGTLKFPSPPYPDRIICPEGLRMDEKISFWRIVRKVQIESILWGLGTAIGELPPYFMARGARLSDQRDAEELKDLEELIATDQAKDPNVTKHISMQKRIELLLHRLIVRAGFIGILLCASIPNPLFDLAGMTCGHFLVPFWSFFGATFIGKALIKVHLQQFTVIAISSEHHVDSLVEWMGRIPMYGRRLQAPFLEYLQRQRANLHNKIAPGQRSWLQTLLFFVVLSLVCSFVISIIHAFAKSYHRRLRKWQHMANAQLMKSG